MPLYFASAPFFFIPYAANAPFFKFDVKRVNDTVNILSGSVTQEVFSEPAFVE